MQSNDHDDAAGLLERWRTVRQAFSEAGSEKDLAGVTKALTEALELRPRLAALDPLATLARHGADVAAEVAQMQDPGRRTLWRLILASERLDRGDETAARKLVQSLDEPYRLPADADDAVGTILPPLLASEPDLAVRLAEWKVGLIAGLEILAAREPEPRAAEVARRLEGSPDGLRWEHPMVRGASSSGRWDLVETFASLIERPHVERMGTDEKVHEPDERRRWVLSSLGSALLRAGEARRAIEVWRRAGGPDRWRLQEMLDAGHTLEVQEYLDSLEPEARAEAEKWALGSGHGSETPLARALEAAREERREEALGLLAEHEAELANESADRRRLEGSLGAVRVLALAGEREQARDRAQAALRSVREELPDDLAQSRPGLAETLAHLEMAAGEDLGGVARRLLDAAGNFEDHDTSYEALQDAVELAAALGKLSELLASLPPPSRDFLRARLVLYAVSQLAFDGQVDEAFAEAERIDDPVDRSATFELLAETLLQKGLLAEAEAAALEIREPVRELCALAGEHAGRGNGDAARRLFELALERSGRVRDAGEALAAASRAGLAGAIRPWWVENLGQLLGEADDDLERWTRIARSDARDWWDDGTPPRRSYGLDEIPGVEDPREELRAKRTLERLSPKLRGKFDRLAAKLEEAASRTGERQAPAKPWRTPRERAVGEAGEARALAARGEQGAAREALGRALAAWGESAEEPWEQIKAFPYVAQAAAALGDPAPSLREALPELAERARSPRDSTRGEWRRDLSWGLSDLGEWQAALAMAHGIPQAERRIEALKWFVLRAPLDVLSRGQEVLEDVPVAVILLARLGIRDESLRSLTDL